MSGVPGTSRLQKEKTHEDTNIVPYQLVHQSLYVISPIFQVKPPNSLGNSKNPKNNPYKINYLHAIQLVNRYRALEFIKSLISRAATPTMAMATPGKQFTPQTPSSPSHPSPLLDLRLLQSL